MKLKKILDSQANNQALKQLAGSNLEEMDAIQNTNYSYDVH